jgi:ATP-dependent Clp protease protease subunit
MEILQGEIGSEVTLRSIFGLKQFMINSPGGSLWEGLAMHDYVKANNVDVGVIGICASAATLPLIASSRRWGTPNSRYLIHNPSSSFFFAQLTADELDKSAKDLKQEQDRALQLYVSVLNKSKEDLELLMSEERVIDANEALELGLITEIREMESFETTPPSESGGVSSLYKSFKMQINLKKMEKEEVKQELSGMRMVLDKLAKFFLTPKLLVLQDVNGIEIDFGDSIQSVEQIVDGTEAKVDGKPAEGEYILSDGTKYMFSAGKVASIEAPEKPISEELKIENEELKADLEKEKQTSMKLTKQLEDSEKRFNEMKMKFEGEIKEVTLKFKEFESKFSEEKPTMNTPEPETKKPVQGKFSWAFPKKK